MSEQWGRPVAPRATGALRPLGMAEVQLDGGFWGERQQLNGDVILRHAHGWVERMGWIENFRAAAEGRVPATSAGRCSPTRTSTSSRRARVGGRALRRRRARRGDRRDRDRGGGRAGGRRLPQHALRPPGAGRPLQRPRVGPRAVLLRPPDPGRGRPRAHARRRRVGRGRAARRRPRLRDVRERPGRVRAPGDRARARRALPRHRRGALPRAGAACSSTAAGGPALDDIARGREYFQDEQPLREARAFRGHAVRARLPRVRRGRRRGRDRRPRAAGRDRRAVGADDRRAHVHHRRHGLAPQRRGLRRGLRAAARPRVLRDVRRDRVGDAVLAAAAGHRRGALRRPGRAHALQRRRDLAGARRARVLLRQPAAPARARRPARPGCGQPARVVEHARAVVQRRVLPDQHRPHAREPRRLRGHRRRARRADPPVRRRRRSPSGRSPLRVETGYPWSGEVVVRVGASDDRPRTLALRVPAWATGATLDGQPRGARLRHRRAGVAGRRRAAP